MLCFFRGSRLMFRFLWRSRLVLWFLWRSGFMLYVELATLRLNGAHIDSPSSFFGGVGLYSRILISDRHQMAAS